MASHMDVGLLSVEYPTELEQLGVCVVEQLRESGPQAGKQLQVAPTTT
eukprot:CAMPEP_0119485680 /NCGR_PEP_ID=MMETSP1344-20130328/12310_1 /TAXON_ID=236787 /ORGANISM="Florenciella parvula, Strain CCMP2471" /LENGTH=47 /DNA_ID= /DNA_START= /DNA_END= /DNA_ORIENTATION=